MILKVTSSLKLPIDELSLQKTVQEWKFSSTISVRSTLALREWCPPVKLFRQRKLPSRRAFYPTCRGAVEYQCREIRHRNEKLGGTILMSDKRLTKLMAALVATLVAAPLFAQQAPSPNSP